MSSLTPSDEKFHYLDGSHRWGCPDPEGDQEVWTDQIRAHVARHTAGQDTPPALMPRRRRGGGRTQR
jgi:hypothetical protein